MEKPTYANLSSRKTPAKHESLRIFLAADRINTPWPRPGLHALRLDSDISRQGGPILLVVYYGRANCL